MKKLLILTILSLWWFAPPSALASVSKFQQQIYPIAECNDGIDNDGDGGIDFSSDPQCVSWGDNDESRIEPVCSDTLDNDGDNLYDYPQDPQCSSLLDTTEDFVETTPATTSSASSSSSARSAVYYPISTPTEPVDSSFTTGLGEVLQEIVFEISPVGRIIGVSSFAEVEQLPLVQKSTFWAILAGFFAVILILAWLIIYSLILISRRIRKKST